LSPVQRHLDSVDRFHPHVRVVISVRIHNPLGHPSPRHVCFCSCVWTLRLCLQGLPRTFRRQGHHSTLVSVPPPRGVTTPSTTTRHQKEGEDNQKKGVSKTEPTRTLLFRLPLGFHPVASAALPFGLSLRRVIRATRHAARDSPRQYASFGAFCSPLSRAAIVFIVIGFRLPNKRGPDNSVSLSKRGAVTASSSG
jgi:hypothetical protein